jgi:hypothetical protein
VVAPLLTRPFLSTAPRAAHPDVVFYSGGAARGGLVASAAQARGLVIRASAAGRGDFAQARWDDLRSSSVAVFDLGATGRERAAVCYDLGLARATGRRVVILGPADGRLPFDVDVEPHRLPGGDADALVVAGALDAALYAAQRPQPTAALDATVEHVQNRLETSAGRSAAPLASLLATAGADPVAVRRALETALGFGGAAGPALLRAAWPARYPTSRPRLFHVTQFEAPDGWPDATMAIVEARCDCHGATYVRGDRAGDVAVIRSIWEEICLATHVLVDLSDANANVALELGLAHGLGRNVATVVQRGQEKTAVFPSIERLRYGTYTLGDGGASLAAAVDAFLAGGRTI